MDGGRSFARGSVVFLAGDNGGDVGALVPLAREIGAETVALGDGWVSEGPGFGSERFVLLSAPRVAVSALNRVDLPTFGKPTMPARNIA